MITYKTELNSIVDFDAWSGGRDVLDKVIEKNRIEELDALIQDLQMETNEVWTDTQLNDFLWFDLPKLDGWTNLWTDDQETETDDNE